MAATCRVGSVREVGEPEGEEVGHGGLIEWGDINQVEWEGKIECEVCWKGKWAELEEELWNIGDVMECDDGKGPVWGENIKGGYKIKMVMDSGACKTIVPPETIPGMKIKENSDTGRNFRAANGKLFPNYGEIKLEGKSVGGGKLNINAQVADVTKPLAAGGEIVDGGSWIILNKKGGAIVKLDEEGKVR